MSQTTTLLDSTHSHLRDDFYFELPDEAIYPFEKSGKSSSTRIRRPSRVINRTDLAQPEVDSVNTETGELDDAQNNTIVQENQEQEYQSSDEQLSRRSSPKTIRGSSRVKINSEQTKADNANTEAGQLVKVQYTVNTDTKIGELVYDRDMVKRNYDDMDDDFARAHLIIYEVYKGWIRCVNGVLYCYEHSRGIWRVKKDDQIQNELAVTYYESKLSNRKVKAVIESIKVAAYAEILPKRINSVLVLNNCAFDLAALKRLDYSPEHYARNKLDFDYDAKAKCPVWLKFLHSIFGQELDYKERVYLLQEYFGLSLTPIVKFERMLWCIGEGSNGKGVIFKVVKALIGSENCSSVSFNDFDNRFKLVEIEGKLVNISTEMSDSSVVSDAKVKAVVSGETICIERKMQDAFSANLVAKFWASANFLPRTRDTSYGFLRRLLILRFNQIFPNDEQDKTLIDSLILELPGIFNWALVGLHRLLSQKDFTIPPSSKQEIEDYELDNDPVALFKKLHLLPSLHKGSPSKNSTLTQDVFWAFDMFCRANKLESCSSPRFGLRLKRHGITSQKSNGKYYYPVVVYDMDNYKNISFDQKRLTTTKMDNPNNVTEVSETA